MTVISYRWRGPVHNAELNALHAEGFGHPLLDDDWEAQIAGHSLGWVCARDDGALVRGSSTTIMKAAARLRPLTLWKQAGWPADRCRTTAPRAGAGR